MRSMVKCLVVLVTGLLVCVSSVPAIELADFSQFDRILNGVAIGDKTEMYFSSNFCTYTGEAWEGKLAKIEPSLDLGVLNLHEATFDSVDDLIVYLKENAIIDLTLNMVELGKMLPAVSYLSEKLPGWVYVGAGLSASYDEDNEDVDVESKLVMAVKIKM